MTELVLDSPVAPVSTPVFADTVVNAAALPTIDCPSPGDIFFNHTGSKILVIDMLLDSVRCFQAVDEGNLPLKVGQDEQSLASIRLRNEDNLTYEKNW